MLSIGIIGHTLEHEKNILKEIVSMENYICRCRNSERVLLMDGTEYFIISNKRSLQGRKMDQLIIAEDGRGNVYQEKYPLIREARKVLSLSCVPEDFLIIALDI